MGELIDKQRGQSWKKCKNEQTEPIRLPLFENQREHSIYKIYNIFNIMVKTIRISDENHKELLKIQGELQAESGEFTSMDDAIAKMVEAYKKKHK